MSSVVCPTITAFEPHEYREQMERVTRFAQRIHIDLMDGEFAPTRSPDLLQIWWPHNIIADIHLMYQRPMDHLQQLLKLRPHMVIIHAEANVDHLHFSAELHKAEIKTGLAITSVTTADSAERLMHSFDQVLIFSGHLGYHGGQANLDLLERIAFIRKHHPEAEIAWDGGINDHNASRLSAVGVEVLNVGGFIHNSENPKLAYDKLISVIKS